MATIEEVHSFIDQIGPLVNKVCKERGYNDAVAWTCIAQACCESAYGTSKLMKNANAFFGIKANKSWITQAKYGGLVYNSKTKECYDGKSYTNITACFRAYNNMEDSVRDYFDLIELPRYRAAFQTDSVRDCITCIKNGGYATSPTYISTICSIYEKYKGSIESQTLLGVSQNKRPILEIACEVILGQWGNGQSRSIALKEAGYDSKKVQALVNVICALVE